MDTDEVPMERYMRKATVVQIFEKTNQVQWLVACPEPAFGSARVIGVADDRTAAL